MLTHRSCIAYSRIRRLLHHLHDLPVLGAHSPQAQWTVGSKGTQCCTADADFLDYNTQWGVVSVVINKICVRSAALCTFAANSAARLNDER